MSSNTQKIKNLLDEQQALLDSIKKETLSFDDDKIVKQNESLTLELAKTHREFEELRSENEALKKELSAAKSALFTKLAEEKLYVFKKKQRELEAVYYSEGAGLDNRLREYYFNCTNSLDSTIKAVESYGTSQFDEILKKLAELKAETEEKKKEIEAYSASELDKARSVNFEIGEALKNESLSEYEKKAATKQKSIEAFVGLNILSKAGILLFIIGIIMLGRFAYVHMSDVLKGSLIYLLAFVLIGVGEFLHKKEKTVFSTTLISGGVATLYAACTTSYFAFNLYGVKETFIICIVVTAIAVLLSNQIKSQIVCSFAAVGGYLPVVALYMIGFGKAAADSSFMPVSSVYFCILAVVIFLMTYNKKWHIAQFIGYALHLIAIGGIAKCAYTLRNMAGYGYALPLAAVFAVLSFVIYLMMPASKIVKRVPLTVGDTVLLTLNTISGAVSVSVTIRNCISNNDYVADRIMGYVFLAFAIIYAVLMVLSMKEKKNTTSLSTVITSISALLFSMLVVPFIFGFEYSAIGWAAEGAVIAIICIEKRLKVPEIAGLVCMLCSIPATYICWDYSVLSVVTLSVVISAFWLYTVKGIITFSTQKKRAVIYHICEIAVSFSSAAYIYYMYSCVLQSPKVTIHSDFIDAVVAVFAALFALVILRVGIFKNRASVAVSDIGSIILFFVTFISADVTCNYKEVYNTLNYQINEKWILVINIVLLIALNIAVELLLSRAVFNIVNKFNAPVWIYTMAISLSTLALITAVLMVQFELAFTSVILSAVYVGVACLLLVVGFKKNYTVVRSSGLVLVLCAFAKLCFADTRSLDSGWKIASYFAFGAILILISFFYQRFSKKIENE